MKTVQLKRKKQVEEHELTLLEKIDEAGLLADQIKELTLRLDKLKGEIKQNYQPNIKEMHGDAYKVVFSSRENWRIRPDDWITWLKKNYTGRRLNELFTSTVKVSIDSVRSTLGSSAIEAAGEKGEPTISASFKKK